MGGHVNGDRLNVERRSKPLPTGNLLSSHCSLARLEDRSTRVGVSKRNTSTAGSLVTAECLKRKVHRRSVTPPADLGVARASPPDLFKAVVAPSLVGW